MKIWYQGKKYTVPTAEDGSIHEAAIREAISVAGDRVLIRQRGDGSNEVINPGQKLFVEPDDRFKDQPIRERGGPTCGR
jgi:hypothetical protein